MHTDLPPICQGLCKLTEEYICIEIQQKDDVTARCGGLDVTARLNPGPLRPSSPKNAHENTVKIRLPSMCVLSLTSRKQAFLRVFCFLWSLSVCFGVLNDFLGATVLPCDKLPRSNKIKWTNNYKSKSRNRPPTNYTIKLHCFLYFRASWPKMTLVTAPARQAPRAVSVALEECHQERIARFCEDLGGTSPGNPRGKKLQIHTIYEWKIVKMRFRKNLKIPFLGLKSS